MGTQKFLNIFLFKFFFTELIFFTIFLVIFTNLIIFQNFDDEKFFTQISLFN